MKNPFETATEGMSREDKERLREACGIGRSVLAADIEAVEPLAEDEQQFFDEKGFISPYFSVQRIYKVRGKISPMHFNRTIFSAFATEKSLKSGYCPLASGWVKVVFKNRREQPEIIYRNLIQQGMGEDELDASLAKWAEAERRRPFDISREPLVRFLVVRTANSDFALVVTGLGLAVRHLNMAKIIVESQEYDYTGSMEAPLPEMAQERKEISAAIMNYWHKVLENLPAKPELPGFRASSENFSQSGFRVVVPAETTQLLKNIGGETSKMMGLLYMAWGLFLQSVNETRDTYFLLLSDEGQGGQQTNLGMIPVRLKCPLQETVASAAARLAKQLSLSSPFSCFESRGLWTLLGERRGLFDHFLNFHAFTGRGVNYARTEGTFTGVLVYNQSWDAQGLPLGIYFQYVEGGISLSILYNRYSFSETALGELCKRYLLTLHTMLLHMDHKVASFEESLRKRLEFQLQEKMEDTSSKNVISYIMELPFFEEISQEKLYKLARAAKVRTFFENDQIIMKHELGLVFFLLEGRVARLMDPGSGWYSMLDVAKEGRILNETVIMEHCKSSIMGEVVSERAKVLAVPLPHLMDLGAVSYILRKRFFLHVMGEMEKYQRRWVNS